MTFAAAALTTRALTGIHIDTHSTTPVNGPFFRPFVANSFSPFFLASSIYQHSLILLSITELSK